MNLLMIGDTFSLDCSRYLSQIGKANREEIFLITLINGCDFTCEGHYRALYTRVEKMRFCINGMKTPLVLSLHEVLSSKRWDVITIQPGMRESNEYENYGAYITPIEKLLHEYAPKARIFICEPWAYQQGSPVLHNTMGYADMSEMVDDIRTTSARVCKENNGIYGRLPFCEALAVSDEATRDFFATPSSPSDFGKYLLSLIMYQCVSRKQIESNKFRGFDTSLSENDVSRAKELALISAKNGGYR